MRGQFTREKFRSLLPLSDEFFLSIPRRKFSPMYIRHGEITCEKYLARVINEKHKIATLPWTDSGKNRRTIRLPTSITDV